MPRTAYLNDDKLRALHDSGMPPEDIGQKVGLTTDQVVAILFPTGEPASEQAEKYTPVPRTAEDIAFWAKVSLTDIRNTLSRAARIPALPVADGWRRRVVTWAQEVPLCEMEGLLDALRIRVLATTTGNPRCRVVEGQRIDLLTLQGEELEALGRRTHDAYKALDLGKPYRPTPL